MWAPSTWLPFDFSVIKKAKFLKGAKIMPQKMQSSHAKNNLAALIIRDDINQLIWSVNSEVVGNLNPEV